MQKIETFFMPFGMVAVISYLLHTSLGSALWKDYNPITTDISSLTALGAPNRNLLIIFTTIYGIAMILFVIGMIIKSFRKYKLGLRAAWIILLLMNLVSLFGFSFFPLTAYKTEMNFQNMMHITMTVVVVIATILASFLLAFSYLKQEKMINLGIFTFIMAIIIISLGALNPIVMAKNLNILGLTERGVIYSLQCMMFVFSFYYTFTENEKA